MEKIKIAYIGPQFHKKTKSTEFLKNLLCEKFEVHEYYTEEINLNKKIFNSEEYKIVILFQLLLSFNELKKIKAKIIWFPMYDGMDRIPFTYIYLRLLNIKVICFSKKADYLAKLSGLESKYLQYFPEITKENKIKGIKILFWIRKREVDWPILKKILENQIPDELILKINFDPGQKPRLPTKEEIKKYNITIIDKWLSKEELEKIIDSCNIYIQPRYREGIGQGFLDAMSRGLCIISPNNGTMNEYIIDKKNGFLFNAISPQKINLNNIEKIQKEIFSIAQSKKNNWIVKKKFINRYIENSNVNYNKFITLLLLPLNLTKMIYYLHKKIFNK